MVRSNNLAWVEPRGELLEAGLALETEGVILHFGFGHHQVGDVLSVLLSTFNVKEDVEGSWGGVLLLGWCHLDEAAVGLNVHLQAGHGADPQRCSSLSCRPRNSLKHPETFLAALADRRASGSGRFAIVGETQVVGQTGGAIEVAATGWAGHGGGTVSGHRLLGNQRTHSADNRHNGWDFWCRHVDRHHCRAE